MAVKARAERAVLVGAPGQGLSPRLVEEYLEELRGLAGAAGVEVVGCLSQRITRRHPRYLVGEGKARELARFVKMRMAGLVIFDDELSPAQAKELHELTGVRVLDRSELILDIFATRARSREARIQVELAQLQYMLPRLRRMWRHLSRIRGGIGLRGPGETQLETDRRAIGRRIADLRSRLRDVDRSRTVQRSARRKEFRVALVGYTNVGKSTLLNALCGTEVWVADQLFATLDSATRTAYLGEGRSALVTDTVGFVRKLPHHLVASFRSTLAEAREADVVLHVIDGSHPEWKERHKVVEEVLADMGVTRGDGRQALVFNKMDRLTHAEEHGLRARILKMESVPSFFVSALTEEALDELRTGLLARALDSSEVVDLRIPASEGSTVSELYREGQVLSRVDDDGWVRMRVRLQPSTLGRIRALGLAIEEAGGGYRR